MVEWCAPKKQSKSNFTKFEPTKQKNTHKKIFFTCVHTVFECGGALVWRPQTRVVNCRASRRTFKRERSRKRETRRTWIEHGALVTRGFTMSGVKIHLPQKQTNKKKIWRNLFVLVEDSRFLTTMWHSFEWF